MKYFTNFPKIRYKNELLIHAPIRFAFQKLIVDRDYDMWDYIIGDYQTPEYIADKYYGNGQLDWIIYLANRVIDPYFSWPLSNQQLHEMIKKKYGSLQASLSVWKDYKDSDGIAINEFQYNPESGHTRVNAYEWEIIQNDEKRKIKLIDNEMAGAFVQQLDFFLQKESNNLSYYLQYNPSFSFSR